MSDNPRITLYMPNHRAMKQVAEEDGKDFNGALFEKLFWDNVCGRNQMLQDIIKQMYQGTLSMKEAVLQVLKYIKFSGLEKKRFFDAIPLIAQDACGNSGWLTDEKEYFSIELEENLKKLRSIINNIYLKERETSEFFDNIAGEDKCKFLNEFGDISSDYSYAEQDVIDYYIDLTDTNTEISEMIASKDVKPGDILDFIKKKNYYFYDKADTYDVIEFCIINAAEFDDNPYLHKRLRDFVKFNSMVQDSQNQFKNIMEAGDRRWQDGCIEYFEK